MPLAGSGMLLTSMDIDEAHEGDFNRWYDREHLEERVVIEGFVEARRYIADSASPKYLSLYSTRDFEVLTSHAYRTALANQTAWSKQNIARFRNMIRAVARITVSCGAGRGAALGLVRIRPAPDCGEALRAALRDQLDPDGQDGVISMHLIESDPELSRPLTDNPEASSPGAADWYVLIDGTDVDAVTAVLDRRFDGVMMPASAALISKGTYRLMWDLAKGDIQS